MKSVIVGISALNAGDNPGPGVGVARSLKECSDLDVQVIGLAYDAMEPGIYLDWLVDRTYILPYPSKGSDEFLGRLQYIRESSGLDWIVPNLDAELPLYIKYQDELKAMGIRTFLPTMTQFKLRGKDRLAEMAESLSIEIPQTMVVGSQADLAAAVEQIGAPVMVKGAFYEAYCAHTMAEAAGYYHKIVAKWGYPVIVQGLVRGDELNLIGVGDGKGGSLGMVCIKKTSVTSLGKVWSAVTVKNQRMLEAAERFLEKSQWRGPFELECIVNRDAVNLIEINPRFPAWLYFATGVGINLPARLLKHAMQMPHEVDSEYPSGKLFMRYTNELVTDMDLFRSIMTQGESPAKELV